jgi:hypothetical protein
MQKGMSLVSDKKYGALKYFEELFLSINQVSLLLLDTSLGTLKQRLFEAMGLVAKTYDVDRMYVYKNVQIDGKLHFSQLLRMG